MSQPPLIDHPRIARVLFHPRDEQGYPSTTNAHELLFPVEKEVSLGGRLYRAGDGPGPLLLYWHGNGEIAADYEELSTFYTGMGIHFLVVDFRGYGQSTGIPGGTALLRDAVAVFDHLREIVGPLVGGLPAVFTMGRSMGSAAAIEIAFRRPEGIRGLILESAFAYTIDLIERLSGLSLQGANESQGFSSLEKMRSITTPTLLLHGRNDDLIPISDGQALFDACGATNKNMVPIPHAGHNDLMLHGLQTYFESIGRFIATIYTS
ncbi:MAG: alpha/beta hydrolase [Magnetococcales bacterium]|nr:alpha/beta hydrolase [Magnetococcales bacterium]